ncbi:MAG: 50S ribosomal protein L9 [Bacteroidia bacterium]|nr:50S ribosomal protein L9 [Bacteroidia bacterium]
MEIILKQDVHNIGQKDDLVRVRNGYGRNYLIPKGYAIIATREAKKIHAEVLKQRSVKQEKLKDEALEMAKKLKDTVLKIGAKTSSTGKIFGSVNTIQIAQAISTKGFTVDRKNIKIAEEPIKEVGTY